MPMVKPYSSHGVDDLAMTLDEVAKELGVSRQRVAQIEKQAFIKIRDYLKRNDLLADDLLDNEELPAPEHAAMSTICK